MQQVNLNIPVNAVLGVDAVDRIGGICAGYGQRAVIIGSSEVAETGLLKRIESLLSGRGVSALVYDRMGQAKTAAVVDDISRLISGSKAQMVIGAGGPGSLSIARAASVASASDCRVHDMIDGMAGKLKSLPFIGVPSSCRDPFGFRDDIMLTDGRNRSCRLLKTEGLFANHILLDPMPARTINPKTFNFTILDTLMYAMEGYFADNCNFLAESLFLKAISAVVTSDRLLDQDQSDREIHLKAARAGFVTAMGLSMSGPGLGASVSMTISSRYRVPRVVVSAVMLPHILEYGLKSCPEKLARIAPILNEDARGLSTIDAAERVIDIIRHRLGLKQIPMRLSDLGVRSGDLSDIADAARGFDFISHLPAAVSSDEVTAILRNAL